MKIAVLGHGTVGSGVCEILLEKAKEIAKAAGKTVELGYVIDLKEFSGLSYSDKFVKDYKTVLDDPEVEIVAEAMGGIEPAFSYIKAALEMGKSTVTSNKELVATKGAELLSIARKNNVNFLFEASVGGGIPLIRPLYSAMNVAGITQIAGILNGTTNYILTQMFEHGAEYGKALADAQALGYAEADPSADVLGIDACRKIAILSSLVWGSTLSPDEISAEGIDKITADDVKIAEQCGFSIKLIAMAKQLCGGKIYARVCPMLVKKSNPLSGVNDVFNAVLVNSETAGEVLFYGKGAGKLPTASAMIADIIECAKTDCNIESVFWQDGAQSIFAGKNSCAQRYYIRTENLAEEDVFAVLPQSEKLLEHCYITPVLTEGKIAEAEEKLGKFLAKIPLFE